MPLSTPAPVLLCAILALGLDLPGAAPPALARAEAAETSAPEEPQLAAAAQARTRKVPRPRLRSGEYLRSWGVQAVNGYAAYRAGATGKGVTVALIDSGLEGAQEDVVVNASAQVDLLDVRLSGSTEAGRHGGRVAGALASALNGKGIIGIAYEASILSIRADIDGACETQCAFRVRDIARGLDHAVEEGARVILLAVEGRRRLSPPFEDALARAVEAGAVVVVAAGNGGGAEPAWPARYAADPRFAGAVLAVGATDYRGAMTTWSNRAGATQASYLVAPGLDIVTACDESHCFLDSGTSFSAPFVAGALALLLDRYPDISARTAAEVLLESARDLGDRGTDQVYGKGMLDLEAAFRVARRAQRRGWSG